MKKWLCTECGYIHIGDEPPELCPICGVFSVKFKEAKPKKFVFDDFDDNDQGN